VGRLGVFDSSGAYVCQSGGTGTEPGQAGYGQRALVILSSPGFLSGTEVDDEFRKLVESLGAKAVPWRDVAGRTGSGWSAIGCRKRARGGPSRRQ
jgi:hypothetical protein